MKAADIGPGARKIPPRQKRVEQITKATFNEPLEDTGKLPEEVTVSAVPSLPGVVDTPIITDRRFGSTNMPADWDHEPLWDLLRWQSWSSRPMVEQG